MFPICDKKDFEIFLILSMIVIFALTILSRSILVVLGLAKKCVFVEFTRSTQTAYKIRGNICAPIKISNLKRFLVHASHRYLLECMGRYLTFPYDLLTYLVTIVMVD